MYDKKTAELYATLGVKGTTYQVSFDALLDKVDTLDGKTVLDFGCGAGRSTRLLKSLHPKKLMGADRDANMIAQAREKSENGIEFAHIVNDRLPYEPHSFDAVFALHVFCETGNGGELLSMTSGLSRLIKSGGGLYIITTNPESIGAKFVSYHYASKTKLHDGDNVTCVVHTAPPFSISDTWWSLPTMEKAFKASGFEIRSRTLPVATGEGWKDETKVAPDVLYHLVKQPMPRPA